MDPQAQRKKPPESLRKLMNEAIDYAGLFPPSQMSMQEAVVNYSLNAAGPYRWMLGRFVLPVARLEEFIQIASGLISPDREKGCRLSVLAGENIGHTIRDVVNFNRKHGPEFCIDSLEVKASSIS